MLVMGTATMPRRSSNRPCPVWRTAPGDEQVAQFIPPDPDYLIDVATILDAALRRPPRR